MSIEEFSNDEDREAFRSDKLLSQSLINAINCLRRNRPDFKSLIIGKEDASALSAEGWEQLGYLIGENDYLDCIQMSPYGSTTTAGFAKMINLCRSREDSGKLKNQELASLIEENKKEISQLKAALTNSIPINTVDLTANLDSELRRSMEDSCRIAKRIELQNQQLTSLIGENKREISRLKSALENSTPIDTVDLTVYNNPPKRQRNEEATPKSNLAFALKQNQAMVRVKEEAKERADTAERMAMEAEQKMEELELQLECPICSELDKQSCCLIPCGHVICHGCSETCAKQTCPTCQTHVERRQKLFK